MDTWVEMLMELASMVLGLASNGLPQLFGSPSAALLPLRFFLLLPSPPAADLESDSLAQLWLSAADLSSA